MTAQCEPIPPCLISIDKEGRWYHQGAEMIHREFIRLFFQNMELDSEGRYLINWHGTRCYVDVEDTAFVVTSVSLDRGSRRQPSRIKISLNDDTQEVLSPDTLRVEKDHVLYCTVKSNVFPARFTRAAYYQLAEFVEEDGGRYFLSLNGRRHYIATSPPDPDRP
jgi:uncharacterized protein